MKVMCVSGVTQGTHMSRLLWESAILWESGITCLTSNLIATHRESAWKGQLMAYQCV